VPLSEGEAVTNGTLLRVKKLLDRHRSVSRRKRNTHVDPFRIKLATNELPVARLSFAPAESECTRLLRIDNSRNNYSELFRIYSVTRNKKTPGKVSKKFFAKNDSGITQPIIIPAQQAKKALL